ncbi:MAG: TIGR01440 family protein [Ruminococcaceae bacterium]|nr:TIGR01440 family protein [Oscillospiraceae bacterium]
MYEELTKQAKTAVCELLDAAKLAPGDIFVVGCSTSEVCGEHIGKGSSIEAAEALWQGIAPVLKERGIFLAAQCCEHLNRAVIIEAEAAKKFGYEPVNVVPQPKAGGSFATTTYKYMENPVAVEAIRADAGIDIGGTLIGMHLKPVAVPVRLSIDTIGKARILCARTRPKFIGGVRAHYDENLL